MTAAHDYDDVHKLVDRLTPEQVDEVGAHALRLAAGRRGFVQPAAGVKVRRPQRSEDERP